MRDLGQVDKSLTKLLQSLEDSQNASVLNTENHSANCHATKCLCPVNINRSTGMAPEEGPLPHKCSNRFLGQLVCQLLIGPGLVLPLPATSGRNWQQLLQSLENFFHLRLWLPHFQSGAVSAPPESSHSLFSWKLKAGEIRWHGIGSANVQRFMFSALCKD